MGTTDQIVTATRDSLEGAAGVRLMVLYGSHARGEAHDDSDIDLGYLAEPNADLEAIAADLVGRLGTDAVDLTDLARASALLRLRVAQHGIPIVERPAGTFLDFQVEASIFWCDVEPVVRAAHEQVLGALSS